jgi:formylglycine-generating enzyme required for sulfatase activity
MAQDIEAYLGSRPVAAYDASFGYLLKLAFRRNRKAFLTGAVAAAALAVLGGVSVWREQEVIAQDRRTSDVLQVHALPLEAEQLFPAVPSMIAEMESWVDRADHFLEPADPWWEDRSASVMGGYQDQREELDEVLDQLAELRVEVVDRLETAKRLQDPAVHADLWKNAIEKIQNVDVYAGIRLIPVEGLSPLGLNTETGLWEFWSVPSGNRPDLNAPPALKDALVLVLIPGGRFGGDSEDPAPGSLVEPFYIGKYEVTQAQWVRLMGFNPSTCLPGLEPSPEVSEYQETVEDLNPVESMAWEQGRTFANRLGLDLLSEKQWEWACRSGTSTIWYWGDEALDLKGRANVLDSGMKAIPGGVEWSDGYALHAPIGSFDPNGFGLYDMHGNVSEWCLEWLESDWMGERRRRIFRGGSFATPPEYGASGFRNFEIPTGHNMARGLRVGLAAPLEE